MAPKTCSSPAGPLVDRQILPNVGLGLNLHRRVDHILRVRQVQDVLAASLYVVDGVEIYDLVLDEEGGELIFLLAVEQDVAITETP